MARLRMTNADYVAIAVSPPLIMTLVGSLVFFLIEVLYSGSYDGRLRFVFAMFVFAAVLIARIAIEFGADRAALYCLPLGVLMFLAMMRFVDHQSPLGWLINIGLLGVVWWCAHELTWDCTLIDDNEDASGEGLLGRAGLDARDGGTTSTLATDNELFGDAESTKPPLWRRIIAGTQGPHTPGVWVLYFSLAALPLFGVGQHWIPAGDINRRRYAFGLLTVYVASALALLVTTSFLGLRRYLRQRHVEMPGPMAVTWVSLGGALIFLVMFLSALLPRPAAEYALAQPPWKVGAPGDLKPSEHAVGEEGTSDPDAQQRVTSDQENAPQGDHAETRDQAPSPADQAGGEGAKTSEGAPPADGENASQSNGRESSEGSKETRSKQASDRDRGKTDDSGKNTRSAKHSENQTETPQEPSGKAADEQAPRASRADDAPELADVAKRNQMRLGGLGQLMGSIVDLVKFVVYFLGGLAVAFFAWKYRNEILNAITELIRDIRAWLAGLFGRRRPAVEEAGEVARGSNPRRRTFAEYRDPFVDGQHQRTPAVELVRYTFEAFEAWASDHGRPRTPDQTPQELVHSAIPSRSPMFDEARKLAALYGEAAYSASTVSRESAAALGTLWAMMRSHQPHSGPPV